MRVVILASGTGTLAQAIIDAADKHYTVVGVIADQPCQAIARAEAAGISHAVVELGEDRQEWNRRLAAAVETHRPDLVVSAGFMRNLGKVINTHPALLPSFPGAHAVRDALAHGVKVTGTTVHYVDEGVDTGPIIAQEAVVIQPDDTEDTLHERIKQVERALIVSVLKNERFASV